MARKNRWGFVVGLASQPFWFITTYLHEQWGVMGITVLYCFIWAYGIWGWFSKKDEKKIPQPIQSCSLKDMTTLDVLAKELVDNKSVTIVFADKLSTHEVCELVRALDGISWILARQELQFEFTSTGLIAKPYSKPE
jgi:hypothetical protein